MSSRKNSDVIEQLFSNRNPDEVQQCLENQPDLDPTTLADSQRNTLLHQLAFEGHLELLMLFLKEAKLRLKARKRKQLYEGDPQQQVEQWVNAQNEEGFTPLLYAAYSGHLDVIRLLVEQGARPQATTKTGLNALHVAAQRNMLLPLLFFRETLSINAPDDLQSTPLHWAAYMNSEAVVGYLVAQPDLACLDAPDKDGNTPLMLAVHYGNTRVVRKLLMAGADRYIRNSLNKTPLEVALDNGYKTIPRMLSEDYSCCDLVRFYCNLRVEYRPKRRSLTAPLVFLAALALNTVILNVFFHFEEWYPIYAEVVAIGTMTLLYLTLLKGPERPTPRDYSQFLTCSEKGLKKVCFECVEEVPKRGYHCDICHCCISQYDHHCTWINNCVGKRNLARFVFFLFFLVVTLGIVGVMAVLGEVAVLLDNPEYYSSFFRFRYPYQDSTERIVTIAVLMVSVISSLFLFPVTTLLVMQLKNLLLNKTMYQSLRTESEGSIKSKIKKFQTRVSLRNCQIMCSENPIYLTNSLIETDPEDTNESRK